jgi:hypothetical protein
MFDNDTISNGNITLSESCFINNDACGYSARRQALSKPQTSSSLQHKNGTPQQRLLPKRETFNITPAILTVHQAQRRTAQNRVPEGGIEDGKWKLSRACAIFERQKRQRAILSGEGAGRYENS